MTPFRSIVMLAAAACGVLGALFIGHAIGSHHTIWYGYGFGMIALATVLTFVQGRLAPDSD
jgi:hypothetical protein